MPHPRLLFAVLAAAAVSVACSAGRDIGGRLMAEDGAADVACTVRATGFDFPSEFGGTCGAEGLATQPPEGAIVLTGDRFRCRVSANTTRVLVVQVRCGGYEPLDVRVVSESCAGLFSACDDIELGTLVVRR